MRNAKAMPCRIQGSMGIGKATHQLCLGPDGAGCSGGLHDARFNMSIRMMVRLGISCLRRLHHLPVFGFALAFKHLSTCRKHSKAKKKSPRVRCSFCTSATWPSASAWRMPARARTRVLCPRLRSASRCRIAVSHAVASSWSCQVDFGLSLSFFGGVDKKVMGGVDRPDRTNSSCQSQEILSTKMQRSSQKRRLNPGSELGPGFFWTSFVGVLITFLGC